jgi:hypothetical protein
MLESEKSERKEKRREKVKRGGVWIKRGRGEKVVPILGICLLEIKARWMSAQSCIKRTNASASASTCATYMITLEVGREKRSRGERGEEIEYLGSNRHTAARKRGDLSNHARQALPLT